MTREQIKRTIQNMRASVSEKQALQRQCDNKEPSALFVVHGLMQRQKRMGVQ